MNTTDTTTSSMDQPHSLFPISSSTNTTATTTSSLDCLAPLPSSAVTAAPPQWLRNTSFSTDLSVISDAASSHNIIADDDMREQPGPGPELAPFYELLESSEGEETDKIKRKVKKKKKKRKRENDDAEPFSYGSRKSSVRAWANSEIKPSKDYYFDSRGDPDNLAFGSLYKMDIVRYKLYDGSTRLEIDELYSRLSHQGLLVRGESDADGLDLKLRSCGRYWSAKYYALERHKNFKRIRIVKPQDDLRIMFDEFIPLLGGDVNEVSIPGPLVVEESWEDEVIHKTRDFNKMTRENPHNVRVWMDFAEFQDKVASRQPQKGARLQMLEKKISILEKAAELNPQNDELLICLLKAYQCKDSADVLIGRWEKVLMSHSGSYRLWREFLHVVQGNFSTFNVSQLRSLYAHAIQALFAASRKKHRHVHPILDLPSEDNVDLKGELSIVDIFVSLCRFEWQAGYHELATALFQAQIEYCLFCPPLHLTEQSKKRLFEHFWNSNGARIGEEGALGWSTWLEKEEETRQKLLQETTATEDEQGGWTGWFVPLSKGLENSPQFEGSSSTAVPAEVMEEEESADANFEEDDAALLRKLGIDADAEAEATKEIHDVRTWVRWSEEESFRDRYQWLPVHGNSGLSHRTQEMDEADEEISRVILFEDINDYLFSLFSPEACLSLVMQFIDFFGGETSHCFCTNSPSWNEKILSLESLPDSISHYVGCLNGTETSESGSSTFSLDHVSQNSESSSRGIMKFLRNAALLCLRVFPRNYKLEEAILFAEEKTNMEIPTLQQAAPSRALAKQLLKNDRQDVLLCGVYARREATFGNIGHARKVFDMALSSIGGLHLENKFAPMLYLWYSEMELAGSSGESDSTSRAVHILSCLGSGTAYSPYKVRPSSTQLLRAHQGFKDRINAVMSSSSSDLPDDNAVALVCSAALYEQLTAGWGAGVKVLSDALSMVLPETKRQSYQVENLFNFQVKMLQNHHQGAMISKMFQSVVLTGFQVYPYNPELFCSLVHISNLHIMPNKLRQIFDDLYLKKPSVILSLFALSYELGRGDSPHRIHGLFERALANDTLHSSVLLWRCYISYEVNKGNSNAARRIFFRAIHACPWSKNLWLDGFRKLNKILSAKELRDLHEVMREKELNLRTDIYEILLQTEFSLSSAKE